MSFAAPGLLGQRVTSGSLAGVVVGWADGYLLVAVDEDDGRRVRRVDWQALTIDATPVDRPAPTGGAC
jgi:hypothetical protein